MTGENTYRVGARVEDREDTDPNPAIIVNRPDATADEWVVGDTGQTVADYNNDLDYPTDAPVAIVVFESDLDDHIDGWTVATPETLWLQVQDHGLNYYTYPVPRLRHVDPPVIRHRRTDDGHRYIHRLHITGVGGQLVFGKDYDGVDHGYGIPREVCFNVGDWTVEKENVVHVEYDAEKDVDELPPLLVNVHDLRVIEQTATTDFLFDL